MLFSLYNKYRRRRCSEGGALISCRVYSAAVLARCQRVEVRGDSAGLRLSVVQLCACTPGVYQTAPGRGYSTPRIKFF